MKKIKMKATGEVGYLTGKIKKKAGRTYHQILFPWTDKENKDYEKYWGKKRPKEEKGRYEWQKDTMFEGVQMKTYEKHLAEAFKRKLPMPGQSKKSDIDIFELFKALEKVKSFKNLSMDRQGEIINTIALMMKGQK